MDIIFGRLVMVVKATSYSNIRLIGVVPHEGQANHWSESWRNRYFALLTQADDVVTLSARYFDGCYQARNRYMVDAADALLPYAGRAHLAGHNIPWNMHGRRTVSSS